MPSAQLIVKVANGSSILLGPQDRVVKEITINCESNRCAARHNQAKPVDFTFDDGGNFPESGDSFLSLILPARSPSNAQDRPRCFCSAGCLKDYLTYEYVAPGPRQPAPLVEAGSAGVQTGQEIIRKTDNSEPMSAMQLGLQINNQPPGLPEELKENPSLALSFPVAGTFVSDAAAQADGDPGDEN